MVENFVNRALVAFPPDLLYRINMTSTLDSMEREQRKRVKDAAYLAFRPRLWVGFLVGFVTAPFALAAFFFIPFMGQLLILSDISVTIIFGFITKKWLVIGSGILGAMTSSLLFYFFIQRAFDTFLVGAYGLLGMAALIVIAYLVFILGSMWEFYQKGLAAISDV